jgi:hypothetical protein
MRYGSTRVQKWPPFASIGEARSTMDAKSDGAIDLAAALSGFGEIENDSAVQDSEAEVGAPAQLAACR